MTKRCYACLKEKNKILFSGKSFICKDCDKARAKSYYLKNKEKVNARAELYRKENLDKYRLYSKGHYENNKHVYRQKEMAYKLAKKQQTPSGLNKAHFVEMEGMYQFCQIFNGFQVDHIVPINGKTVSGFHAPWNLQVLTCKENAGKSNIFNPQIYPQQGQCAFMEF